jgi:hypothetical protein
MRQEQEILVQIDTVLVRSLLTKSNGLFCYRSMEFRRCLVNSIDLRRKLEIEDANRPLSIITQRKRLLTCIIEL